MDQLDDPVLIRAGALPVRHWLTASNRHVFDMVDALSAAIDDRAGRDRRVASLIGEALVPQTSIGRTDRALLLSVRRALHGGKPISLVQMDRATTLARDVGAYYLAEELTRCGARADEEARLSACVEQLIEAEAQRLLKLVGDLASDSPVARALLDELQPPSDGERANKERRRFLERSWRIVTRSATDPTPRGWMSHVCITTGSSAGSHGSTPRIGSQCHVHWTESVRSQRRAASDVQDPSWPDQTDRFGANPLRWSEDGEQVTIVLDRDAEPAGVVMRETTLLRSLLGSLAMGPRTLEQLCADLAVDDGPDRDGVRTFVRHLLETGVVEAVATPRSALTTVEIDGEARISRTVVRPVDGWIDVYRPVEIGLDVDTLRGTRERLHHVLRLLRLIDPYRRVGAAQVADRARSLTFADILKTSLARGPLEHATGDATASTSLESSTDTAAGKVRDYLSAHRAERDVLNIPLDLVDELDANAPGVTWPVDCLVRLPSPDAPFRLVVRGIWPAGTIDSRFSDGLRQAFAMTSRAEHYRDFLRHVEALTGIAFVEILAPPLSERADNAVRRPAYTSAWTGDPNRELYLVGTNATSNYVSLHNIEFTLGPSGLTSSLGGRRLWPIYHATRDFSPPWDRIAHTLLATAPLSVPFSYRRPDLMIMSTDVTEFTPRIVLGEDIVLRPAEWSIRREDLWARDDDLTGRIRGLTRARRNRGLPRWVEVSDPRGSYAVGCDLESVMSISPIDQLLERHGAVRVSEMLPTPEQFILGDRTHLESDRVVSEMVVRLPTPQSLPALAEQVATEINAVTEHTGKVGDPGIA